MIRSLPVEYPYDDESVFSVCKACGSIFPVSTMSQHKKKCPVPERLRLKIVGSLFTMYSGAEINEKILKGQPFPTYTFTEEELSNNMSGPSLSQADDDEIPEVNDSVREERQRRIEERRRQRRSYMQETPVMIPNEEEEDRRRRERREERRRRREAEAALEREKKTKEMSSDEQSLSQSDQIDLSSQVSRESNLQELSVNATPLGQEATPPNQEVQEITSRDQEETPIDQPTQEAPQTERDDEEARALLQLELNRLRQKAEEEKRQEEEKRKKKKEEQERLIQVIEKQRKEADLKKQREIERLKREKECEVIAEAQRIQQSAPVSSPSPLPSQQEDENTSFDVMLQQEEERKEREEKKRREEERMWQKRAIELETNQTITLSESTGIKHRGPSIQRSSDGKFVTRETTAVPCQRAINQKYSIVSTKPNAVVKVQTSQLVDLDVNPFANDTPDFSPISPPQQQNPKPSANPFGREEDVLSRFKECNEVVVEPVPMDSSFESSPRNPFDKSPNPTNSNNPFDRLSESMDSVKNPFDRLSMQETKVNPFDQSEETPSKPLNPFDQSDKGSVTPRNPFDQSEESSSKHLNPFDQSDKSETKPLNPFDQSDKSETEPLNPFDRKSLTAPSESCDEEAGLYRKSVVKDAMNVLEIAAEGKMTAAELQNQMELHQEEKQIEAISSLYDTDPDEFNRFVQQLFNGIECWKWCSNGKYHKTTIRCYSAEGYQILQWDRKKGLFKEKTSEIDCSTITKIESPVGTNQIIIECDRTLVFECFTKSAKISLFPGLRKLLLPKV